VRLLLLGLLAFAQPAPASAQANPRVPAWNESHNEEGNRTVITLYRLATCAQRTRQEAAAAYLASERGSVQERTALDSLIIAPPKMDPCLTGGATRFSIRAVDSLRGAVAESTYNGDKMRPRGAAPLPDAPSVAASAHPRDVIACAVARDPMLAHRLLQVNYGSPPETRFLRRMNSHFLACLPPQAILRATRVATRTYIADALLAAARRHRELFINA
jgi:hypothetical protein